MTYSPSSSLPEEPLAESSRRAYARDLAYFWVWSDLRFPESKRQMPVNDAVVLTFLEEHARGLEQPLLDRLVAAGVRRKRERFRFSTLYRKLIALSRAHDEGGHSSPLTHPKVKRELARIKRYLKREGLGVQQKEPITGDILAWLLMAVPKTGLRGKRDRALLLVAFHGGGRRRSELAAMKAEHLRLANKGYHLKVPFSKRDQVGRGQTIPIYGAAYRALKAWLAAAGIGSGAIFRPISRSGEVLPRALSDRAIYNLVRTYALRAGLDGSRFSPHSLRSGFITEACRQRVSIRDIMQLSGHRDLRGLEPYIREGEIEHNPASSLR